VPRAEPVNVEIEGGGQTHTGVQRRHGDSASPILHLLFTHAQPPRCARRADAGPFECPVEAGGQGPPEAVVLDATLEVTDIRGTSTHLVERLSDAIFLSFQRQRIRGAE
jgi:hypothetical protein